MIPVVEMVKLKQRKGRHNWPKAMRHLSGKGRIWNKNVRSVSVLQLHLMASAEEKL